MAEYISSKENLLKNARRIILNYDNEILKELGKKYGNVSYFSLKSPCDAYIKDRCFYLHGKRLFSIDEIKLMGKFNLLNVLASILATYEYVTEDEMKNEVCSFCGVSNRLELASTVNGVKFYNSSADTTPSRTVSTLSAFEKKRCVIILGGSDKNLSYDILGKELNGIKSVILLGENKHKILASISGYDGRLYVVNNLKEAVTLGFSLCQRGDSLLLSPASASFDMYESYIQRGEQFRKLVKNL